MSAPTVGVEQRIAWLLTTSRLFGADRELAKRPAFLAALAEHGITVDSPRISRWESGLQAVPPRVVAAYETVLGLPEGWLVSVSDGLRRTFSSEQGLGKLDHRGGLGKLDQRSDADLEALLDATVSGKATGAEWMQLADCLGRYDRVFLRASEWEALSSRLVGELATSVGAGYQRRYEAAAALIRHPSSQYSMMMAIGAFLVHPHNQVFSPVLTLLAEVSGEQANELVLRLMQSGIEWQRKAAASVAAAKLGRGHFAPSSMPFLEAYAAQTLRGTDPLDGGLDCIGLAAHLPQSSWTRLEARLGHPRLQGKLIRWRATQELIPSHKANETINDLATAVQRATAGTRISEPDALLRRLLHESLLHVHKARRHYAALLLAASPYAPALASVCHDFAGGTSEFVAARAWTMLMRVGHGGLHEEVRRHALAETRSTVRPRALVNLGLCSTPLGAAGEALAAQVPELTSSVERQASMFALGMTGDPSLRSLAGLDGWVGDSATWWLEHGPAVHDSDLPDC
ncbi:hypothetical protein [Nocardioides ferulae]|uniref:hypothetical protein n=1 Tax=Nocardioides ferulae TaxID=2340821 RepID=UPI000EB139B0|nr:hypothetical protein [Nocardioides ferulae]